MHAWCSKIIEDLLELMFYCTFVGPVKRLSTVLSLEEVKLANRVQFMTTFTVDEEHQRFVVKCSPSDADDGGSILDFDCTKPGFILGKTPLTEGRYTWKVHLPCQVYGTIHVYIINYTLSIFFFFHVI